MYLDAVSPCVCNGQADDLLINATTVICNASITYSTFKVDFRKMSSGLISRSDLQVGGKPDAQTVWLRS